jgi:hypothetical protein
MKPHIYLYKIKRTMLILRPGTHSAVFTLNEKFNFYTPSVSTYDDGQDPVVRTGPYYVFVTSNHLNGQTFNILLGPDNSGHTERYNEFDINVIQGTESNPINAEMNLYGLTDDDGSQWRYEVWACDGPSPIGTQSVVIDFGTTYSLPRLLEVGKMIYTTQYGKPIYQPSRL